MTRLPHATFTNLYGPTETTIASSYYTVPTCPEDESEAIPIGTPCEGEELLVLSETLRPVSPGEVGNLYIRGVGLSPGYWRGSFRDRASIPGWGPPHGCRGSRLPRVTRAAASRRAPGALHPRTASRSGSPRSRPPDRSERCNSCSRSSSP